jgi:hypothetical protein
MVRALIEFLDGLRSELRYIAAYRRAARLERRRSIHGR